MVDGCTYDKSSGVAGVEPFTLCAKLPIVAPTLRDWLFGKPGAPPMGKPKPHPEPLPAAQAISPCSRDTVVHSNKKAYRACRLAVWQILKVDFVLVIAVGKAALIFLSAAVGRDLKGHFLCQPFSLDLALRTRSRPL